MDYAPPLVLLAVYPQNSANTPSKTSFAKQNGGGAFCASTIWARTARPNLACCRFLKLKSLTHTGEGIAVSVAAASPSKSAFSARECGLRRERKMSAYAK